MLKVAPASEKRRYLRSNAWISDDLLPFDKASSMTSFLLKVVRSSSAITGNDCMKLTTWLTFQIAHTIQSWLNPLGVAVVMEAGHLCMMMRGVEKQHSKATTSAMLGVFRKDRSTRMEFLGLTRSTGST